MKTSLLALLFLGACRRTSSLSIGEPDSSLTSAVDAGLADSRVTLDIELFPPDMARAPADFAGNITLGDQDTGKTVTVFPGNWVYVQLTDPGDGAYLWSVVSTGGLPAAIETRELPGPGAQPGDFGTDDFEFTTSGVAAGTYTVQLAATQPLSSVPGGSYTFTVVVQP